MNRVIFFGMLGHMLAGDLVQVQNAYWLAKNAHRLQKRDGGERYFEHPRSVALILMERGYNDRDTIVNALLHDVVEDTNTPSSYIVNMFGHGIWHSLNTLSKVVPVFDPITGQTVGRLKKDPVEYRNGLFNAPLDVVRVKLADRLHNVRTMQAWNRKKRQAYASKTREEILPLARNADRWFATAIEQALEAALAA